MVRCGLFLAFERLGGKKPQRQRDRERERERRKEGKG